MNPDDQPGAGRGPLDEMNIYCRTCRKALNVRTSALGEVSYHHTSQLRGQVPDHQPDPVPLAELTNPEMVCDFCSAPNPVWTYVCDDQLTESRLVTSRVVDLGEYRDRHAAARTRRTDTIPGITQSWGQRWAACEECATHLERADLYGLITRVTDTLPAKLTRGRRLLTTRGQLHAAFNPVLDSLTPGRGRITPDEPLGVWEPTPDRKTS
jgi:hypothetical protein